MYRKIVWFYFSALILLEFSLQSRLAAHENSDDVTHDSLVPEGVSVPVSAGGGGGDSWLVLDPPALSLGRVPLGEARAARVTLHNRGDATLHLASVAGTTPDFHASFFHSKTVPAGGNTSFSVVFVARGEGPAAAELFLHTSKGLHKYQVVATGSPSAWCVGVARGLRVAHNTTTAVPLHLCNPTEQPLQIVEAFSSAMWCGVVVGGAWSLDARSRAAAPPLTLTLHHHHNPHTAYLRIKFNNTAVGSLTVRVDVTPTRALTLPSHVDLGTRGSADETHVEVISGANPLGAAVRLEPRVCATSCVPDAHEHHANGASDSGCSDGGATSNGASHVTTDNGASHVTTDNGASHVTTDNGASHAVGVTLRTLSDTVAPHAAYQPLAELTLDFGALWELAVVSGAAQSVSGVVRCSGALRLGGQSVAWSARVLAGTLRARPAHAILSAADCAGGGAAAGWGELTATNMFTRPIHILNIVYPLEARTYFTMSPFTPAVVSAGAVWRGPRLSVRHDTCGQTYSSHVTLVTNVTHYHVPLAQYTPATHWEFDWVGYSGGALQAAVPMGRSRRIEGFLATQAPAPQYILDIITDPPDVKLLFSQAQLVVPAHGRVPITLVVPSPVRAGAVSGSVTVRTRHVTLTLKLTYSRVDGDLELHDIALQGLVGSVEMKAQNSLQAPLLLRGLAVRGELPYALHYTVTCQSGTGALETVTSPVPVTQHDAVSRHDAVSALRAAPCRTVASPRLSYLHHSAIEGGCECESEPGSALERDAARVWARASAPAHQYNFTLHMYTTQLLQVSAEGWATPDWTHLASPLPDLGGAVLGSGVSRVVRVVNPSAAWPLWLQPVLSRYHPLPDVAFSSSLPPSGARTSSLADVPSFSVSAHGGVAVPCAGAVLVPPGQAVQLNVTFTPHHKGDYNAFLYLRNNMTGLEAAWVRGRGVAARVSLRGGGALRGSSPTATRASCTRVATGELVARNEAVAPLRSAPPLIAGVPCAARGFTISPCPHPDLNPQQVVVYTVEYVGEWSVVSPHAELQVPHAPPLTLSAHVAPAHAARCSTPPEGAGRGEGRARHPALLLAVLAAAAAVTAAACRAEAVLKRAVASMRDRDPHPAPHLLDLRALARTTLHAHVHTTNQSAIPQQPGPAPTHTQQPARTNSSADTHTHKAVEHALTVTASSLARHKRKVKKILAEIKHDLAKTRPTSKSPNFSDDFDTQLLEDDLSRSSNEESVDTNADELNEKSEFCVEGAREKFDSHDDFGSQYKYDKYSADKNEQSNKYSTHHCKEKTDAHYKPNTPTDKSDKYESRSDKSRYDKVTESDRERYRESSEKAASRPGAVPCPCPSPSPAPDDDADSTGTDSDRERHYADSPHAHQHKREGASETASRGGSGRRRERAHKRDSNTPPRPVDRQRHARPKARVVARRRSPGAGAAGACPCSPLPAPAPAPPSPPAPPALRATFSEVVSCGAPPPPPPARATPPAPLPSLPSLASHAVRDPPASDSLFYYSASRSGPSVRGGAGAWSAPPPLPAPVAPPPAAPLALRSDIFTHAQDRHSAYNDSSVGAGVGSGGSVGGVGGGAGGGGLDTSASWWGAGWRAVRPPPGFAHARQADPPAHAHQPPDAVPRTFDPLNALAGVWEGGAWRDSRDQTRH